MKTFTDTAGRSWEIGLNLGTALAVKERLGIDLLQPEAGDPPLLTRLGTDELLLGQVLCVLLEPQFDKHGVTDADVRASFDGQTLLVAQQAFYEELIDFFRHRGRSDRARAVETQMKMIVTAVKAIETRIDTFDVDRTIHEALAQADGEISGSSPASSVSIPGR